MADLKPAYLVHGDDDAKLDSWRERLRARARDEGPSTSLEVLAGDALTIDAFVEATGALTLSVGRRYVLADSNPAAVAVMEQRLGGEGAGSGTVAS